MNLSQAILGVAGAGGFGLTFDDRVRIKKPKEYGPVMPGTLDAAFEGKTGRICGEEGTRPRMYRVCFDAPVEVPGVGRVRDDLWEGKFLRKIR